MWWSMRFDAENNRWDFAWTSQKIAIGEYHRKIRATIENFSDVPVFEMYQFYCMTLKIKFM